MKKKFMFCYYFKLLKGSNLKRHVDSKHTFYFLIVTMDIYEILRYLQNFVKREAPHIISHHISGNKLLSSSGYI